MQANRRSDPALDAPALGTADRGVGPLHGDVLNDFDAVDAVLDASRVLVAVSARSIAAVDPVTLPQYRMLVVLDASPTNLSALAEALDVAPSTATRMVDRLVATGLVERTVPPDNRREVRLATTEQGHATVAEVTARRRRDIAAALTRMPPAERAQLATVLSAFAAAATGTVTAEEDTPS